MIECEINTDRGWRDQFSCGLHCVWFRADDRPELCPVGEAMAVALEEAARVADAAHDRHEATARMLDRGIRVYAEERALACAQVADDIRGLMPPKDTK